MNFDSSFPREDLDARARRRPWGLGLLALLLAGLVGMLVETSHRDAVVCDAAGRHVAAHSAAAKEAGARPCAPTTSAR